MPHLVGAEAAVRVIVLNPMRQNRMLTGPEALELGFADRLLEPVEFVDESIAFARDLANNSRYHGRADWSQLETGVRKTRSRIDEPCTAPRPRRTGRST